MKTVFSLLLFTIVFNAFSQNNESYDNTTYYFIRHAEKDRRDKTNKDPHLSKKGEQRAEKWRNVFSKTTFDAIYSTPYNRTQETVQPIANANNIELNIYDPKTQNVQQFLKDTKGKTVLIAGHSNTVPRFVNSIIGKQKYSDIDDNTNSHLYIINISNNGIFDHLLLID